MEVPSPTSKQTFMPRFLLQTARIVSLIFSPLHLPLMAMVVLLSFTYMSLLPVGFTILLLLITWFFTVGLPRMLIRGYMRLYGLSHADLRKKRNRVMPYALTIISYTALLGLMLHFQFPRFLILVGVISLAVLLLCSVINPFYNVSSHAAGAGAATGTLMGFSLIYGYEATGWLCLAFLLSGIVCTGRVILRRHTLGQTALGMALGMVTSLACILLT